LEPSVGLAVDAVKLAIRLDRPADDCFYLALAVRAGSPLITADRRFFERCQQPDATEFAGVVHRLGETGTDESQLHQQSLAAI
jgi:predicted nucleic acid-binding protein